MAKTGQKISKLWSAPASRLPVDFVLEGFGGREARVHGRFDFEGFPGLGVAAGPSSSRARLEGPKAEEGHLFAGRDCLCDCV